MSIDNDDDNNDGGDSNDDEAVGANFPAANNNNGNDDDESNNGAMAAVAVDWIQRNIGFLLQKIHSKIKFNQILTQIQNNVLMICTQLNFFYLLNTKLFYNKELIFLCQRRMLSIVIIFWGFSRSLFFPTSIIFDAILFQGFDGLAGPCWLVIILPRLHVVNW